MIVELVKLANDLDAKGLVKEADIVDALLKAAGTEDHTRWNPRPKMTSQEEMAMAAGADWYPSGVSHEGRRVNMAAIDDEGAAADVQAYVKGEGNGFEPGFGPIKSLDDLMQARDYASSQAPALPAGQVWEESDQDVPLPSVAQQRHEEARARPQQLPEEFIKQLRQLTPQQMQALGALLMEGGPMDIPSANDPSGHEEEVTA